MFLDFLPKDINDEIIKYDIKDVYEIRLRENSFLSVNVKGKYFIIKSVLVKKTHIEKVIDFVTERSLYAFNEEIKNGFITYKNGIRIGLCGKCVFDNGYIKTITDISSLNIRIPHFIENCSDKIFSKMFINNKIQNSLIISPPFLGKTTMLKDLALKIDRLNLYNILIIDERGEFLEVKGQNIDIISYSDKNYAFSCGIRSMSPNIIITDELMENDWEYAYKATNFGVKIIASIHSDSLESLTAQKFFNKNVFSRYFVLSSDKIGEVRKSYDWEFNLI